ncbi:MAG: hypothetical protein Q9169_006591 [Polycauliona sp. 2 TL-2023]
MKIIVAGSTGFIGHEVLTQLLSHPRVHSIVALTRRPLPSSFNNNPKLTIAILEDFLTYPADISQQFDDTDACICITRCLGKAWMPDNETARKVCVEYTMAAAREMTDMAKAKTKVKKEGQEERERKFRFVYLSGGAAERDQTKALWFKGDYRRIRGQVENELLAHAKNNQDVFEVCIMRPGMVLAKETSLRDMVRGLGPSVGVEKLAGEMVKRAEGGGGQLVENWEIQG